MEMSGEGTSQSYQSKAGVRLRCEYRRASLKAVNDSGRGILLTLVFMENWDISSPIDDNFGRTSEKMILEVLVTACRWRSWNVIAGDASCNEDDEAHSSDEMREFRVAGRLINIRVDGSQDSRNEARFARNEAKGAQIEKLSHVTCKSRVA